jgi:hypothetical protein
MIVGKDRPLDESWRSGKANGAVITVATSEDIPRGQGRCARGLRAAPWQSYLRMVSMPTCAMNDRASPARAAARMVLGLADQKVRCCGF